MISAFALNNWNDNRRDDRAESKILLEILNGIEKDVSDIEINLMGHEDGINACRFWRRILNQEETNMDTLARYYLGLTRDFTSIQNTSGYETLKSRGFELINNDSLRSKIISLYEYDYQTIKKFEEEYNEMQFQENYFHVFNAAIAPSFIYDANGRMVDVDRPLSLSLSDKNLIMSYLWKIELNRTFVMHYYEEVKQSIADLSKDIEMELGD